MAGDKGKVVALADYYHRRLQPKEELAALMEAAKQPSTGRDALNAEMDQRSWKLFERALALADAQALRPRPRSRSTTRGLRGIRLSRAVYAPFEYSRGHGQTQRAQQQIDRYVKAFPKDEAFPLQARARLLPPEQALTIYERAFRPVLPANVVAQYFELLNRTRNLRKFLADARAAVAANPNDLNAAAKLFYYYQQQGNLPQAHRALIEYRMRARAADSRRATRLGDTV